MTTIHKPWSPTHSPGLQGVYPAATWNAHSTHPAYSAPVVKPQAQRVAKAAYPALAPQQAPPPYNPAYHAPSAPPAVLRKPIPQPPQKAPAPSKPDPYATDETYDTIKELKYDKEFYTAADSKVSKCIWTFLSPLEDYRESSVIITNLLVPIIEKQVKQLLQAILGQQKVPTLKGELDQATAQRIQQRIIDPLLSKLPKEGEKIDALWREEARKHAVNIGRVRFSEEFVYLAKAFKAVHSVPLKEAVAHVLTNPKNSLADALGCEADRVFGFIIEQKAKKVAGLVKQTAFEKPEESLNKIIDVLENIKFVR